MASEIAEAEVIGVDEDDIRPPRRPRVRRQAANQDPNQQGAEDQISCSAIESQG
jgi:hypothetical protein